jgi:arylsulfatase A-like enzyme
VRLGLRSIALVTVWFALLAGLSETAFLTVMQHLLGRIIYRSAHYLWMPAAGALFLFSLIMMLAWLLARAFPRVASARSVFGLLIFLSTFSVLMVPRWLHPLAVAVLSAGVGLAASQRLAGGRLRFQRFVQASLLPIIAVVAVLAGASFAYPRLRERSALAGLAHARAGSSNIIFLILDTVRAKSLSLYGYSRATTPNLAALAKRGVVFDLAISPAPWTLPAHASFFTGKAPHELSADRFAPLDNAFPTLAEKLAERGYATAGFVANLAYASREFGLERGFHHWDDYQLGFEEILTNSSLGRVLLLEGFSGGRNSWLMRVLGVDHWIGYTRTAADVNGNLLSWLDRSDARPFFVFANYFDAHLPYLPPETHLGRFGPIIRAGFGQRLREERPGKWPRRGNAAQEEMLLNRYEESVSYLDAEIGELVRALQTRGLLENTIVVISADHGEEFGEHGFYEHDSSVFLTQTHVPLLMIAPGKAPLDVRVQQPAGLIDLPATLLQLSTGEIGVLPGTSLSALWSNDAGPARPVVAELDKRRNSQAALTTPQYHYIRFKTGEERLFDLTSDRAELRDLSQTAGGAAVLPAMRDSLRARVGDSIFQRPPARKSSK